MEKGRSVYTFQLNCNTELIHNLVNSFLQVNKFTLQNENGEQFYRAGDAMVEGYKYFNYSISGNTLTISAWLKSLLGEIKVEQNNMNIFAMNYRNLLNSLFQEINNVNNGNIVNAINENNIGVNNNINATGISNNTNNINQFAQNFQEETQKKQEKMCEIGFWLSLLGVFLAFGGMIYGIFVYILVFYFAAQGLNTRKKGKAKVAITLTIISIIIGILWLIGG